MMLRVMACKITKFVSIKKEFTGIYEKLGYAYILESQHRKV